MYRKLIFVIFVLSVWSFSFAAEYHVDKTRPNLVKFISDALVEDIEGVTGDIDGYLFWEDGDTLGTSEIYFEVDLNTVDTGIGLRNRHMRENYLETDKYPMTYFKGKLIRKTHEQSGILSVTAEGVMFIHGIEQKKSIQANLIPEEGGFHIKTSFSVALPDYDIEVPQLMFLKINEIIKLELDVYLKKISKQE